MEETNGAHKRNVHDSLLLALFPPSQGSEEEMKWETQGDGGLEEGLLKAHRVNRRVTGGGEDMEGWNFLVQHVWSSMHHTAVEGWGRMTDCHLLVTGGPLMVFNTRSQSQWKDPKSCWFLVEVPPTP